MVDIERYHVMSETEILEKLNKENPAINTSMSDHAMMAWEYLEEPINENESDSESVLNNNSQKNLTEEEETNDEFSESSSSTDYDHLE